MIEFDNYKGTIIKLINVQNGSEIYGYLEEVDEVSGMMKLHQAIVTMNKMVADGANTLNDIIQYKYNATEGSTLVVPAATVYKNEGTKNIIYLCYRNFIVVPLYEKSLLGNVNLEDVSDSVKNKIKMKDLFTNYIEFIYSNFDQLLADISKVDSSISKNNINDKD